jgi:hypothetical protein
MTDARDEISRIIEQAEQAAYKRGWDDAFAEIAKVAQSKAHDGASSQGVKPGVIAKIIARRTGRPSSNAMTIVEDAIASAPGMKGVDVVKAAQAVEPGLKERTIRTCLRRLRINKTIWKRSDRWYPKSREKSEAENGIGEAVGSPPH